MKVCPKPERSGQITLGDQGSLSARLDRLKGPPQEIQHNAGSRPGTRPIAGSGPRSCYPTGILGSVQMVAGMTVPELASLTAFTTQSRDDLRTMPPFDLKCEARENAGRITAAPMTWSDGRMDDGAVPVGP